MLEGWVDLYQSDICRFRAMTLSPLHTIANWPVFTIYILYPWELPTCEKLLHFTVTWFKRHKTESKFHAGHVTLKIRSIIVHSWHVKPSYLIFVNWAKLNYKCSEIWTHHVVRLSVRPSRVGDESFNVGSGKQISTANTSYIGWSDVTVIYGHDTISML